MRVIRVAFLTFLFAVTAIGSMGQALKSVAVNTDEGFTIAGFNGWQKAAYPLPLISFQLNGEKKTTLAGQTTDHSGVFDRVKISCLQVPCSKGLKFEITFFNLTNDTLQISNIVPFGESDRHVYITSWGKPSLSMTHLFRPDYQPLNVIVPDNAWELGFSVVSVDNGNSIAALTRRDIDHSSRIGKSRFSTALYPGGSLRYSMWMDSFIGTWQAGLKLMFKDRMLYDVEPGQFDEHLIQREDQQWIRESYVSHFVQVWYNYFYDYKTGAYTFGTFEGKMRQLFGGDDCITLWHGFPVLGIDQRNQFDLLRSLPGGPDTLRKISDEALSHGNHIITAYNPWDLPAGYKELYNSTRSEKHVEGLGKTIQAANLWGLMYDTRSEGNSLLQKELDQYKMGIVIFPEGMPVPEDMQNSVVGRVHAALEYPPVLNLNKLIRQDFACFQQTVIEKESMLRNFSLAFFNGYGVDIHLSVNPNIDWLEDSYCYLGRTARILRESSHNFIDGNYTPLLPTVTDSIWVNAWELGNKIIYTIFSILPTGHQGLLFEVNPETGTHFVDLWNHREIEPLHLDGKWFAPADIAKFNPAYLKTNNEGQSGCIGRFEKILKVSSTGSGKLIISADRGDCIKVWEGLPSYNKEPLEELKGLISGNSYKIKIPRDRYVVIQLFDGSQIIDESIVEGELSPIKKPAQYLSSKGMSNYESPVMKAELRGEQDLLILSANAGSSFRVIARDDQDLPPIQLNALEAKVKLLDNIGVYEGDLLIQLLNEDQVIEQCTLNIPYRQPRIASTVEPTVPGKPGEPGMAVIPAGKFLFKAAQVGDWSVKHPVADMGKAFSMESFLMDIHPVTNKEFKKFMEESGYQPKDDERFLFDWSKGNYPGGRGNYPVNYVSYEDARAYAQWAGKRLPTEKEWQYAAQAGQDLMWPWGNEPDSGGNYCNPGNGVMDPVGTYPEGANPLGLLDLTGSVWQLTNDLYRSGTIDYVILKGGCYFDLFSSWWYVKGGPLPLINRQQLLRVSQGYERSSTIGFRCIKDL